MLILGIDPGSRHTGFAVVARQGSRLTPVTFGRWSLPSHKSVPERLGILVGELEQLLEQVTPGTAVLESLFHGPNSRSLIVLAQARGALLSVLARHGLEIREYSPAEVKSAVTGNGRAGKQQVSRMVGLLLGVEGKRLAADETDALAVAICGAQRLRIDGLARASRS